jgi:hypothetical protein
MVTRKPFSVESVAELLRGYGYLDSDSLAELLRQAPLAARKIQKEGSANNDLFSAKYEPHPPEIIASLALPLPHDPKQTLTDRPQGERPVRGGGQSLRPGTA